MERPLRRSMLETRLLLLLPIGSPGVMLPKELKADMDEAETPVAKEEEGGREAERDTKYVPTTRKMVMTVPAATT